MEKKGKRLCSKDRMGEGERTVPLGAMFGIDELSVVKSAVTSAVAVLHRARRQYISRGAPRRNGREKGASEGEGGRGGEDGEGLNAREVGNLPNRREHTSSLKRCDGRVRVVRALLARVGDLSGGGFVGPRRSDKGGGCCCCTGRRGGGTALDTDALKGSFVAAGRGQGGEEEEGGEN